MSPRAVLAPHAVRVYTISTVPWKGAQKLPGSVSWPAYNGGLQGSGKGGRVTVRDCHAKNPHTSISGILDGPGQQKDQAKGTQASQLKPAADTSSFAMGTRCDQHSHHRTRKFPHKFPKVSPWTGKVRRIEGQRVKGFLKRSHIKATGDCLKQKRLSSHYLAELLGFPSTRWGRTSKEKKITYQSNTEVLPFVKSK